MRAKFDYDLIVIGGGAAGCVAAQIVAKAGRRVAIVERGELGGQSAKFELGLMALQNAAHGLDAARAGAAYGLRTATLGYNFPSVKAFKDAAVARAGLNPGEEFFRRQNISLYRGNARFIAPNEITINRRHLSAAQFLLATGSRPRTPGIAGLDKIDVLTPEQILNLTRPPKSLFIVGAGSVGTSLAELFAIFGSKVYLSDLRQRILPREDDEASELFSDILHRRRGVEILTGRRVVRVEPDGLLTKVVYLESGNEKSVKVEKVLIAAGRQPNLDLGLNNANLTADDDFLDSADNLQTTARQIFVAGSASGKSGGVATSIQQARVAAAGILGRKSTMNYGAEIRLTGLSPQLASVGVGQSELARRDLRHKTGICRLSEIAGSRIAAKADGFVKIITSRQNVVIGGSIAAPGAAALAGELALAIRYEMDAAQAAQIAPPFGTTGEALRAALTRIK